MNDAPVILILPEHFDIEKPVMPLGYVRLGKELERAMIEAEFRLVIAPATTMIKIDGEERSALITSFAILPRDAAAPQPVPIERDGTNRMFTLDDLPLDDTQKALVLEWFAKKLWVMLEEGSGDPDYYGKMYDPLVIDLEAKEAHSYVFDLPDGGRHHPFSDLLDLEEKLKQEGIRRIRGMRRDS